MASTKNKASRSSRHASDATVTVAFHHVDGAWQGLAARREGGRLRVLETRTFAESDRRSATRWVEERRAGRILIVLPSSRVICRSCALPDAPADRLRSALELQAEAHLSAAVPAHRLGMAVLPKAINRGAGNGRTGLLVGWPESAAAVDSPINAPLTDVVPTYVADIACLAALLAAETNPAPLSPTDQPVTASLWLDRHEGAVAVAVPYAGGLAFRSTRAEFEDAEQGRRDVVRAVAETLLSVDENAAAVRSASDLLAARLEREPASALLAPPSLAAAIASSVDGVPAEPAWWDRFAIALGATICAEGELQPLTRLERDRPTIRPTPGARIATILGRPRTAVLLALLGVVAIAIAPLAFARIRLAVLQLKVPDLKALAAQNQEDAKRRAMYSEMRRQTWPMSKILADVANCTPEGVVIEEVSVDRGQGVAVNGVASPFKGATGNDRALAMHAAMERTGVFSLVKVDREAGKGPDTIDFRLSANVVDPFRDYIWTPEDDFAVSSLALRRYGKETTPGVEVPPVAALPEATDGEAGAPDESSGDSTPSSSPPASAVATGSPSDHSTPKVAPRSSGPSRRSGSREGADAADASQAAVAPEGEAAAEHGADAAHPTGEAADGEGERARSDGRNVARRGDSASSGKASGAASRGDRSGPSGPEVPEPLSDEAITAMSKAEATAALAKVAKARQNTSLDEETAARLRAEFDKLLQQTRLKKEEK